MGCKFIRNNLIALFQPKNLPLWIIFGLLYIPFVVQYGWDYMSLIHFDLPTFYTAGVEVFQHGGSPYLQGNLQSHMSHEVYVYPYLYPPPTLLFFYPFTLGEYTTVQLIVLVINHLFVLLLLWFFMRLSWRISTPVYPLIPVLTLVYILSFNPIIITLNHGQVNILLLLFLCGFWIFGNQHKPFIGSLFLALGILLKTYPILFLPLLWVIGRKKEFMYTLVWLGVMVTLSVLILPHSLWHEWITRVMPTGGYGQTPDGLPSPAAKWNQSLNGFFARAFTESEWSNPRYVNAGLAVILTYAGAGIIYLITLLAVRKRFRSGAEGITPMIMAALPAMFLMAPISWEHHLVYLLPTILLLLTAKSNLPRIPTVIFYASGILAAMFIALPYLVAFKFYAVLVIWCFSIFTLTNRHIEISAFGLRISKKER